jgi:hypothetical protein
VAQREQHSNREAKKPKKDKPISDPRSSPKRPSVSAELRSSADAKESLQNSDFGSGLLSGCLRTVLVSTRALVADHRYSGLGVERDSLGLLRFLSTKTCGHSGDLRDSSPQSKFDSGLATARSALSRLVLKDEQWERIARLRPAKASDPSRCGSDSRLFLEAVLGWCAPRHSGAICPRFFGFWNSVFRRFRRWAQKDVLSASSGPSRAAPISSTRSY